MLRSLTKTSQCHWSWAWSPAEGLASGEKPILLGKYCLRLSSVYLRECLNIYFKKSSTCSYTKGRAMVTDAVHVIFYWFRTEQELSYLIPFCIHSTCTGLQLIFYSISGWKNTLISVAVLLLKPWDIKLQSRPYERRNKRNIVHKMLYILQKNG